MPTLLSREQHHTKDGFWAELAQQRVEDLASGDAVLLELYARACAEVAREEWMHPAVQPGGITHLPGYTPDEYRRLAPERRAQLEREAYARVIHPIVSPAAGWARVRLPTLRALIQQQGDASRGGGADRRLQRAAGSALAAGPGPDDGEGGGPDGGA